VSGELSMADTQVLVTGDVRRAALARLVAEVCEANQRAVHLIEIDPREFARGVVALPLAEVAVIAGVGEAPIPARAAFEAARSAERLVLDADDPESRRRGALESAPITWCSLDPRNPVVLEHLDRGGDACLFAEGMLELCAGEERQPLVNATDLAFALGGAARDQLSNALLALGAGVALGLPLGAIRHGLLSAPPPARITLGGATLLFDAASDVSAAETALRTAAELPAARRRLLCLSASLGGATLVERARLAGLEPDAGPDLDAALERSAPGDLVLVFAGSEEETARARIEWLRRAGWRPGSPLPR